MIADMYKRREKLGYVLTVVILLIAALWLLYQPFETAGEWLEMLWFLLPLGMVLSIIATSRFNYNKVKDIIIPPSEKQLPDLQHVVIKKDAAFVPRLLLFEKDGAFIGMVKPLHLPWWMAPLGLLGESILHLLPVTYGLVLHHGKTACTFRKTGGFRRVKLIIFNENNEETGTYIQEEWKSFTQMKGSLYDEHGEERIALKTSGFSGDFKWYDEEGRRWASFYNGWFPHEYTNLFRDMQNDIAALSDDLSHQDKIRIISVISWLFLERIKK
ncbi:hypothetical protein [Salibacterium qingdaonense]|uniref:Uncharacterized protein n=1 Tax=Salibacterium qingdaonense TaxID=266892 RepID=A0A1I4LCV5_9BACI|nr:hypothetical protein [Salibacterium qingdaonense]SFL88699.1 hypothetical protein SAMN04488054_10792 [Salibacterium qingdaonense]